MARRPCIYHVLLVCHSRMAFNMKKQTQLPRWRGFNLLGMFRLTSPGYFDELDFQYISEWGFDFVRLPLNYNYWIDNSDPFKINESKMEAVDQAVRLGEKYSIHVNISLHRAPGFCVSSLLKFEPPEPFDLWRDKEAQEAFISHWQILAKRYSGIDNANISYNPVNEPAGVGPGEHEKVMRATIAAIREIDQKHTIILDGLEYATVPMPDLGDLARDNVAQSCRGYIPAGVTCYRSSWHDINNDYPEPAWPGGWTRYGLWDRRRLELHYGGWAAIAENFDMGVHCGEWGCFSYTPHTVTLSWMEDVLDILKGYNIGYALWNFEGPFGIINSNRSDVSYEDLKGRKLDRKMLDLLMKY